LRNGSSGLGSGVKSVKFNKRYSRTINENDVFVDDEEAIGEPGAKKLFDGDEEEEEGEEHAEEVLVTTPPSQVKSREFIARASREFMKREKELEKAEAKGLDRVASPMKKTLRFDDEEDEEDEVNGPDSSIEFEKEEVTSSERFTTVQISGDEKEGRMSIEEVDVVRTVKFCYTEEEEDVAAERLEDGREISLNVEKAESTEGSPSPMFQFCNPISVVRQSRDLGVLECEIEFVRPKLHGVTTPEAEVRSEEGRKGSIIIESTIGDGKEGRGECDGGEDSMDEIMEIEEDAEKSISQELEEFGREDGEKEQVNLGFDWYNTVIQTRQNIQIEPV